MSKQKWWSSNEAEGLEKILEKDFAISKTRFRTFTIVVCLKYFVTKYFKHEESTAGAESGKVRIILHFLIKLDFFSNDNLFSNNLSRSVMMHLNFIQSDGNLSILATDVQI